MINNNQNQNLHNKRVAFILNTLHIVPAIITRSYPDGRCNLTIQNIRQGVVRKVVGKGTSARVETSGGFFLQPESRVNVRECDPCAIIKRNAIPLDIPQSGHGLSQTHTDRWEEIGKARLPNFNGMATSLIGKWFDPSRWNYVIYCQMIGFHHKVLKEDIPAIEMNLPQDGIGYYGDFEECFQNWFQERFESRYMIENGIPHIENLDKDGNPMVGEWSRCEIQAVEKEDKVDTNSPVFGESSIPTYEELLTMFMNQKGPISNEDINLAQGNKPKPQGNPSRTPSSKSRKIKSRASLSKSGKRDKG